MAQSHVFAGVGGYYASKDKKGLAGVFRGTSGGGEWQHALSELEAYTVFVHPRDPNLVFAGTADGIYRSTDRGATFKRATFPIAACRSGRSWRMLPIQSACWQAVRRFRSIAARMPARAGSAQADPQLPDRGKAPFAMPRDAVRATSEPAGRNLRRARSRRRDALNRWRRKLERLQR